MVRMAQPPETRVVITIKKGEKRWLSTERKDLLVAKGPTLRSH